MIRFASIGSGSKGNGTVVQVNNTTVLVDCGFGLADTQRRLGVLGLAASDLDAILVTHEHGDHASGVERLACKFDLAVYLSAGTLHSQRHAQKMLRLKDEQITLVSPQQTFSIGDFNVIPVSVPHDAREPIQYVFESAAARFGLLTDLGSVTPHVRDAYKGCHGLLLEFNHDLTMLRNGPYPISLQRRVAGDYGHLNNEQAALLLKELAHDRLSSVAIAHMSEKNNSTDSVLSEIERVFGGQPEWLTIASQDQGFDWLEVSEQECSVIN